MVAELRKQEHLKPTFRRIVLASLHKHIQAEQNLDDSFRENNMLTYLPKPDTEALKELVIEQKPTHHTVVNDDKKGDGKKEKPTVPKALNAKRLLSIIEASNTRYVIKKVPATHSLRMTRTFK